MMFKNVNDHTKKDIYIHVILKDNIDDHFKKLFIKFHAFIDFDVFDKTFIDKKFAFNLNLKLVSLKNFRIFAIFDKSIAACDSIIYYVDIYFKLFAIQEDVRLIRFYVIEFFH